MFAHVCLMTANPGNGERYWPVLSRAFAREKPEPR